MKGKSFFSAIFLLAIWMLAGSGLLVERHVCHKKGEQTLRIAMHTHHHCGPEANPCCSDDGQKVLKNACCEHHQFLLLSEEAPVSQSPSTLHVYAPFSITPTYAFGIQNLISEARIVKWEENRPPPNHLKPSLAALSVFRI